MRKRLYPSARATRQAPDWPASWATTAGGGDFRYMSRFERVSGLFAECGRDHVPVYLVDVFAGRSLGSLQLTLRVDNLLQYHYVLTERKPRPSRTLTFAVSGDL